MRHWISCSLRFEQWVPKYAKHSNWTNNRSLRSSSFQTHMFPHSRHVRRRKAFNFTVGQMLPWTWPLLYKNKKYVRICANWKLWRLIAFLWLYKACKSFGNSMSQTCVADGACILALREPFNGDRLFQVNYKGVKKTIKHTSLIAQGNIHPLQYIAWVCKSNYWQIYVGQTYHNNMIPCFLRKCTLHLFEKDGVIGLTENILREFCLMPYVIFVHFLTW